MASEATYSIKVAWSSKPPNAFTFGTSTLSGGDVLTGQFADFGFTGAYNDITADVKRFTIDRGRDDFMDQTRAGTCTIVLKDTAGRYNPKNAASPLNGQLIPMRPVRIQATHQGTTYTLFYGFIRTIEANPNPNALETVLECSDLFIWLSRVNPTITTVATTTGQAIGYLLDAASWNDPTKRSLQTGDTFASFTADGSKSVTDYIADLLETERGQFFISDDGAATYRSRQYRTTVASSATFSGTMTDLRVGLDLDRVRNRATVTKTGGVAQTASDGDSIAAYGVADATAIDSPYLQSDVQALSLANYIVTSLRDPRAPARGMTLYNENTTIMTQILARELGDRVTVTEPKGNTSGDFFIERIQHSVGDNSSGSKIHRCEWTLSERPATGNPFVFSTSTLSGGDVLTY